jgi:sugar phosphate permease
LSLTWKDFIVSEFHWNKNDYGTITAIFPIAYVVSMLLTGKFVDWMDTKKVFYGLLLFGLSVLAFMHFVVLPPSLVLAVWQVE